MKKFLLLFIFTILYGSVVAQKPMVGVKEETIRNINRQEFGRVSFDKEYFDDFWVLVSLHENMVTYYYFEYGGSENIICSQFIEDYDLAKEHYTNIALNNVSISEKIFYEERTKLFIHIKRGESGVFIFTWSKKKLE